MLKLATTVFGAAVTLIVIVVAAASVVVSIVVGRGESATASQPSQDALADIPGTYLALYRQAATTCPGLDWSILAGVGKIETDHGRLNAPGVHDGENVAGAGGPMQFLRTTFDSVVSRHRIPPGGSTPPSRYNPHDAIYAAAAYLCDNGARDGRDVHGAIFSYNHADWYVRKVVDQAQAYQSARQNVPQQGGWAVPARGTCSSGFGSRGGELHLGQDIGVITTYGHNERNHVQTGQHIQTGQVIAEVGDRGESTGPHLHFQIDVGDQSVDPVAFYQQQSAPPLCG